MQFNIPTFPIDENTWDIFDYGLLQLKVIQEAIKYSIDNVTGLSHEKNKPYIEYSKQKDIRCIKPLIHIIECARNELKNQRRYGLKIKYDAKNNEMTTALKKEQYSSFVSWEAYVCTADIVRQLRSYGFNLKEHRINEIATLPPRQNSTLPEVDLLMEQTLHDGLMKEINQIVPRLQKRYKKLGLHPEFVMEKEWEKQPWNLKLWIIRELTLTCILYSFVFFRYRGNDKYISRLRLESQEVEAMIQFSQNLEQLRPKLDLLLLNPAEFDAETAIVSSPNAYQEPPENLERLDPFPQLSQLQATRPPAAAPGPLIFDLWRPYADKYQTIARQDSLVAMTPQSCPAIAGPPRLVDCNPVDSQASNLAERRPSAPVALSIKAKEGKREISKIVNTEPFAKTGSAHPHKRGAKFQASGLQKVTTSASRSISHKRAREHDITTRDEEIQELPKRRRGTWREKTLAV